MKRVFLILVPLLVVAGAAYAFARGTGNSNRTADSNTTESSQQAPAQDQQPSGTQDTGTGQADNGPTDDSDQAVAAATVEIVDFGFSPATLTVNPGTTVTWTNQDTAQHNVVPDEETSFFKAGELLAKGESYSVTFDEPGTYTYYCGPHPNMRGTIVVTEQ